MIWSESSRCRDAAAAAGSWGRSVLFRKRITGIFRCSSRRQRVRVCGWTPSVALITSTAASSTPRARSISPEKSVCPGVSRNVRSVWFQVRRASFEKMVIPRSFSMGSVSRKASP